MADRDLLEQLLDAPSADLRQHGLLDVGQRIRHPRMGRGFIRCHATASPCYAPRILASTSRLFNRVYSVSTGASGSEPHDRRLARPGADTDVALELFVQRTVAGVHKQAAALERRQLVLGRHDDDVIATDGADDVGADLLIAAP